MKPGRPTILGLMSVVAVTAFILAASEPGSSGASRAGTSRTGPCLALKAGTVESTDPVRGASFPVGVIVGVRVLDPGAGAYLQSTARRASDPLVQSPGAGWGADRQGMKPLNA